MIIKEDIGGCWMGGEPTYIRLGTRQFEKIANSTIYIPERMKIAIANYKPDDKIAAVVVHGLGSSEFWGQNRNGDAFPEEFEKKANLTNADTKHEWGFHTFEKNAYPYRNHNNKGRHAALGPKVACAAWNAEMHRVELLLKISRDLAPDIARAIDNDEPLMWSMGARVPYDICTKCSNMAKTAMQYCKCLRDSRNRLTLDGIKIGMINPQPNFFDISNVGRGADQSAFSLAKVASWGDMVCDQRPSFNVPAEKLSVCFPHKIGERDSTAALDKEVPMASGKKEPKKMTIGADDIDGETSETCQKAVANDMHRAPSRAVIIIKMRGIGPEKALPLLARLGIMPTPGEVKSAGWELKDIPEKLGFDGHSTIQIYELEALVPERSLLAPVLGERLLKCGLHAGEWQDGSNPVYQAVVQSFLKTAADPIAFAQWVESVSLSPIIAHMGDEARGLAKQALDSNTAVKLMLVPMILGGIYSHKEAQGEKLSGLQRFIAQHPVGAGMTLNLLAAKLLGRSKRN